MRSHIGRLAETAILEEVARQSESVLSGSLPEKDYRWHCGIIEGLRFAANFIKQAEEEPE